MRKVVGIICGLLGVLLAMPSLMFVFINLRGFAQFNDNPVLRTAIPIQLTVAMVLLAAAGFLLLGGKKKLGSDT